MTTFSQALFSVGRLVATPGALQCAQERGIHLMGLLSRHVRGDWGDLCDEDKRENEFALGKNLRLFSSYKVGSDCKFWIITEADRSATTVLLPDEY